MKKFFTLAVTIALAFSAYAQNPFDVNTNVNATKSVDVAGPGKVATANGMVFKGTGTNDPLHYKIVDDAKLLAEVTGGVRAANLSGKIQIPSTVKIQGKTYKVVNIGENAFDGCNKITSIEIIGNNLQKLGHFCFKNCTGLNGIILNSNCLNLKSDAFVGCSNLKTIRVSQKANNFSFDQCPAKVEKY